MKLLHQESYWPFMKNSSQSAPQLDRVLMLLNTPTASENVVSNQEAIENSFVTIKGNIAELMSNNRLLKCADEGQTTVEGLYDNDMHAECLYNQGKREGAVLYAYQDFVQSCIAYPDTERINYPVMELCSEAGEVAGKVKKCLRGDSTLAEKREDILDELCDTLFPIAALCHEFNYTLAELFQRNIDKLTKRKEAGTIKGDGDKR